MAISFNILTDAPTLTYPNGGETFTHGSINIQWTEPSGISTAELVWYEIFITDSFDPLSKPELLQIATIPSGNSSYSYYLDRNLKGEKCRVGIRAVNHEGLRSHISYSADNFTIVNKMLPSPAPLEPTREGTYFSYLPVILDHQAVVGRCSQRSFYQIYYKSDNHNIDWTLLKSNIMVGSDPFEIDVRGVPTSSDYIIKIELVDGDNVSQPLFLDGVTINNINYFLIDTVPPKGSVQIVDNDEYTKDTGILLKLTAYDETSDVKEFQIEQKELNSSTSNSGQFSSMTPLATWDIMGDDGPKLIQARFKDYGDNVIQSDNKRYFRTYKNIDDKEVTAIMHDGDDLYIAFGESGNPSSSISPYPQLYKNQSLLSTLIGDGTSIESYRGVIYVAVKDGENKGILQRVSGSTVASVVDNDSQYTDVAETIVNSLYFADSVINTMEVFDDTLFMGLQNGSLLSFDGSTITVEHNTYLNTKSINRLFTDGNLLYVFFSNSNDFLAMSKATSGDYTFTTVEMED